MPYGGAILICLMILKEWNFIASTPTKQGVSNKPEKAQQHGVDLRSLHFPTEYHATGVLSLPTSNINEPFEVWHSQTYDKSRIDYYHGKSDYPVISPISNHNLWLSKLFSVAKMHSCRIISGSFTGCFVFLLVRRWYL